MCNSKNQCGMEETPLSESTTYLCFAISNTLLSEKFPALIVPVYENETSVSDEQDHIHHIYLDDFSFNSYVEYFAHLLEKDTRIEKESQNRSINWELAHLVEKHQNKDILEHLIEQAEDMSITVENVVETAIAALKLKNLDFCADLSDKILDRCLKVIYTQDIDVWQNCKEEEDYEKAAIYLSRQLARLKIQKSYQTEDEVNNDENKKCTDLSTKANTSDDRNSEQPQDSDGNMQYGIEQVICPDDELWTVDEDKVCMKAECQKEAIDPSKLGESQIYVRYPISKKLLAQKSPVFKQQFCGPLRSATGKDFEHLEADFMSPEAYQAFFAFLLEDRPRFSREIQDCRILIETFILADKYHVDDLTKELVEAVKMLDIKAQNLVISVRDIMIYKDLAPKNDVQMCWSCHPSRNGCIEIVHRGEEQWRGSHLFQFLADEAQK